MGVCFPVGLTQAKKISTLLTRVSKKLNSLLQRSVHNVAALLCSVLRRMRHDCRYLEARDRVLRCQPHPDDVPPCVTMSDLSSLEKIEALSMGPGGSAEARVTVSHSIKADAIRAHEKWCRASEELEIVAREISTASSALQRDMHCIEEALAAPPMPHGDQPRDEELHAGRCCRLATEHLRLRQQVHLLELLKNRPSEEVSLLWLRQQSHRFQNPDTHHQDLVHPAGHDLYQQHTSTDDSDSDLSGSDVTVASEEEEEDDNSSEDDDEIADDDESQSQLEHEMMEASVRLE